ncbi:MAG: zf-HC2 domain-containing protein [Actinomycetota bacterium]|nr:zf-HC2 domain-containing protein [Actinomycetota bacterium]
MSAWHAGAHLLHRYATGDVDPSLAASLEAHVQACGRCRADIAGCVAGERLARGLDGLLAALDSPRPGPVERLLRLVGVSEHHARLLAATPSLRLSWLLAIAVALAFAVGAAHLASDPRAGVDLFLVIAPLLPLAGVAAAYGPGVDPTYDIGVAAPLSGWRLLLLRAAAVLSTTTMLGTIGAVSLPGPGWAVAAWLLPSLALTLTSLALSTALSPLRGAGVVAAGWLVFVTVGLTGQSPALLTAPALQGAAGVAALLAVAVLIVRRRSFEVRAS